MPKVSDVFQSRFLKAVDLLDDESGEYRTVKVTIERVEVEQLPGRNGQEQTQPVIYFVGKKKCLPLNKTNSTILQEQIGDEMDDWAGNQISLYVTTTTFEGAQKNVIRITPKGRPRKAAAPAAAAAPSESFVDDEPVTAAPARRAAAPAAAPKPFDPDEVPF